MLFLFCFYFVSILFLHKNINRGYKESIGGRRSGRRAKGECQPAPLEGQSL